MSFKKITLDLGVLGEVDFVVEYTCSEGRPATRWEPDEPAEIEFLDIAQEGGAPLIMMVEEYIEHDDALRQEIWEEEIGGREAAKADYYYEQERDRKLEEGWK